MQNPEVTVTQAERESLNGHRGAVIWLTGLSGAGKSTLANALERVLHIKGIRTYILDGDKVRDGLNKDLSFSDNDRRENIRRIAEVAALMMDAGIVVITAFISPFRAERQMARQLIGDKNFFEVYVSTPLAQCEKRDTKGLYRKARSGELLNMTGIDSPYEEPQRPNLQVDTTQRTVEEVVQEIYAHLQAAALVVDTSED
ncbi:adenylyl-sulfate kinase [Ectopseudomonas guguanensis]|uniref:Adenylyl-sulfate kinase n=1 Tax=Ectopseudomonas guguanensis TaxID=1198456 RepID=A0A1H0TN73_9GAMM|nr:adenylyl-sulfate kinase [Pseudomonas guguanensis]SDP55150.1 adenylylsulfate kinase/bifunctional enzyme CysN/CysC [Pseudomonas guguanensis]